MTSKSTKKNRAGFEYVDNIPLGRIFLALDNPRFEPVESEADAIERLCSKEDVVPLARDIVRHGLSPLERFAMTPIGSVKSGGATYWVSEGNRRICALKLLIDPELAPPKFRKIFERLADGWAPIKHVDGVVFNDMETLQIWLDRVHSGTQGGVGRKNWDAEQKQRFSGSAKNRIAQAVLDYAESQGMITKAQRQGKLTTVQRFLSSETSREAFGIEQAVPEELSRNRPKPQFDMMLRKFMSDVVEGTDVTSRKNKDDIIKYVRTLTNLPGVTNERVDSEPLTASAEVVKSRHRKTPNKPQRAKRVHYDQAIANGLKDLKSEKLESLYYSICAVELELHAPLIAIGVWAFFETLTARAGRNEGTSFEAFLSKSRLSQYGVASEDQKAVRSALDRIKEYGNLTKHHKVSAAFNGDQINNDMMTLQDTIQKIIQDVTK